MSIKVYAGSLSRSTTEDELREAFMTYGEVVSAMIVTDRNSRSIGFGFVEMSTDEEALAAIAGLNGAELGGNTIKAEKARARR
jgi:RNA recognition motif-containing protein